MGRKPERDPDVAPLVVKAFETKARYYICAHHNKQAGLCPEAGPIPADAVEEETLRTLLNHVLAAERLQALFQWTNDSLNSGLDELELRIELVELEQEMANSRVEASPEEIEKYVGWARGLIDGGEFFDLREVCEQLCSRVVMGRDECQFEVHFPAL